MKKLIRYSLKALAWLLGIIVFLWVVLWVFVELNEAKLIAKISGAISEKTRGEVRIGGASVSFIRTFPVLSLQLSHVLLRDSLYAQHKRDFLSASDIYLRFSLRELIHGRSALGRITVYNGQVNLVIDSAGRSNEYILRQQKAPESKAKSSVPVIVLYNTGVHYEDAKRRKLYDGQFRKLQCEVGTGTDVISLRIGLNAHVNNFSFSTRKGSYIRGSTLEGLFQLNYNLNNHNLLINDVRMNIDGQPFRFNGFFTIDRQRSDFSLTISTENIEFEKARSLLADSLQSRLAGYAFSKPISPQVTVSGQTISNYGPDVRIRMHVDMSSVVKAAGLTSMKFPRGVSDVDVSIVSSAKAKDTLYGDLEGRIALKGVQIDYLPRRFTLNNCTGVVKFDGVETRVDSLSASTGQTNMQMSGQTKNLIYLSPESPGRLVMNWRVGCQDLHIKDFTAFLSQGKVSSKQSSLDKLFSSGDVNIALSAARMEYNHFKATRAEGKLVLKASGVQLQKVSFNHANGSMELSGEIRNGTTSNPVVLRTKMIHLDVPLLFSAFDNFGQDAITHENLKGELSANVIFSSAINDRAELISGESKGRVDFLLRNGELNNFQPLMEVSKKAFKKQDFSDIRFADLSNRLDISGTTFIVNPMEIRSTVATIFVEGVYDYKKGSDMSIVFPLRNLTKSQANTDLTDEGRAKKGVSLRLRAKTGDDGKLKVSWDPFGKSIRNRDVLRDSLNTGIDQRTN